MQSCRHTKCHHRQSCHHTKCHSRQSCRHTKCHCRQSCRHTKCHRSQSCRHTKCHRSQSCRHTKCHRMQSCRHTKCHRRQSCRHTKCHCMQSRCSKSPTCSNWYTVTSGGEPERFLESSCAENARSSLGNCANNADNLPDISVLSVSWHVNTYYYYKDNYKYGIIRQGSYSFLALQFPWLSTTKNVKFHDLSDDYLKRTHPKQKCKVRIKTLT